MKTYQGMPCKTCGNTERYTRNSRCVHCAKAASKAAYQPKLAIDREGIKAALKEGQSIPLIAVTFAVSTATVYRIRNEA